MSRDQMLVRGMIIFAILTVIAVVFLWLSIKESYAQDYTGTDYILDSQNLYLEDHDYMEQQNRQRVLDTQYNLQQQIKEDDSYRIPDPAPPRNFHIIPSE